MWMFNEIFVVVASYLLKIYCLLCHKVTSAIIPHIFIWGGGGSQLSLLLECKLAHRFLYFNQAAE